MALTHQQGHSASCGLPRTVGIEGDTATLAELRARLADPTRKLNAGHRQVYQQSIAQLEERARS